METSQIEELNGLLGDWTDNENQTRKAFVELKEFLEAGDGVKLSYVARPGITYSLRAAHENQTARALFAMVDVIDDDPADRWLSVCFYSELISDPEERGDEVPEGLLGEDATCFDVDAWDDDLMTYVKARLEEARQKGSQG